MSEQNTGRDSSPDGKKEELQYGKYDGSDWTRPEMCLDNGKKAMGIPGVLQKNGCLHFEGSHFRMVIV